MTLANRFSKGTVMIVDDTPGNLALLSDTLSGANYRVLVATDGLSAIEQIQYLKPDIILLDVLMPGIDGFETCRQLKADTETADIPVLFMTGLNELDDLLRGFGQGALDYIVKPIRPPEVLARIEVHMAQTRAVLRAEHALDQATFPALAIDGSGRISWLTPTARNWLYSFSQQIAGANEVDTGEMLPDPLLEWARLRMQHSNQLDRQYREQYRTSAGFTVRLMECHLPNEYILLLQQESCPWDPQSLKETLKLTHREAEILMWIARGKTNKEVGIILGSSPRTINKHLEHIFDKLGVATRAAAVAMALQQ
ncbi:MAG: response regulator [Gammaproteobacteria bacterium]